MQAAHAFLATLAIVLGVAAITTILFQRLRQPVVLGYIIAGLIVGPHLPLPLNADPTTVSTLSELGVILLMFAIGLELSIDKLVRVVPTAGVIAVIQVAVMVTLGFAVGRLFGWTQIESVFAGSAIAISSTTIIAKVFDEMKVPPRLRELVYGVLIVEDIIAILLLATMGTVASGAGLDAVTLAITTGKLVGFLAAMVIVGLLVVPRLMRFVVRLGRPETTVVASIGICFVFAHACAAAHYSVALGAFVAGMLISESGEGHTVEHLIVPVRDMFAAIFFVSVGMLIDPTLVLDNWQAVLVLSAAVIVGKLFSVSLGGIVTGCGFRTSVEAGVSLSQIGEFSFIIVALGLDLKATRPFLFPVAVAVSAITTLTTPALIRRSTRIATTAESWLPKGLIGFVAVYSAWLDRARAAPPSSSTGARLRRLGLLLTLDGVGLVGLVLGGALLHERIERALAARFEIGVTAAQVAVLALALLVSLPFLFGVIRLSRALALTAAGLGDTASEGGAAPKSGAARSIAIAVQLALLTAIAAASIGVIEPFLPTGAGLALGAALVLVAVYAFVANAKRFDVEAKAGGAQVMKAIAARLRSGDGGEGHGAHHDPGPSLPPELGAPSVVTIDASSPAVGLTLATLDLRAKTGAAVLALVRDGNAKMLPEPDEHIRALDGLVLVGADEAIASARALLVRDGDLAA